MHLFWWCLCLAGGQSAALKTVNCTQCKVCTRRYVVPCTCAPRYLGMKAERTISKEWSTMEAIETLSLRFHDAVMMNGNCNVPLDMGDVNENKV